MVLCHLALAYGLCFAVAKEDSRDFGETLFDETCFWLWNKG